MNNWFRLANAVRILAIDSVERAQSGHPGMPMGMAEIAINLWQNHLKHNPKNPQWFDRDRFVLSNGHGSILLYIMLHLTGYFLELKELMNFRQFGSQTPGHPEYGHTSGVETTTGPLGQGLANATGMAIAEHRLAYEFNRDGFKIVDHYTYVFVGDGCLMEGISHEACSLAGTMKLNKLIVYYDANGISIDGEIDNWFNEDVKQRFNAYGWNVIGPIDGHDFQQLNQATVAAKSNTISPSLIICKTIIAKGSPNKSGKEIAHGSPLGVEEIALIRAQLDWNYSPFVVPDDIYQQLDASATGIKAMQQWQDLFDAYQIIYPQLAQEFIRRMEHQLPNNFTQITANGIDKAKIAQANLATRVASQQSINHYAKFLPELFGGSADLTASNLTNWQDATISSLSNNYSGNYLSYGVREFAMSAIINGIYLHGGLRPFAATFLMFSEYARNAIRMAALMKIASIFVYTHDSIGLGEDGPTHQAVEQLATIRLIPNMHEWRPADSVETMIAWSCAFKNIHTPSCLIFSRQKLDFIPRTDSVIANIAKGGYIISALGVENLTDRVDILIIATGSELKLALKVADLLYHKNKFTVRIVSMPSTKVFDIQIPSYKAAILNNTKYRVVIEAGVSDIWYKYVGLEGIIFGVNNFGESAPADVLFKHFGLDQTSIYQNLIQIFKSEQQDDN